MRRRAHAATQAVDCAGGPRKIVKVMTVLFAAAALCALVALALPTAFGLMGWKR